MLLAKKYLSEDQPTPALRFVVQDRPEVAATGYDVWRSELPGAFGAGAVSFQGSKHFSFLYIILAYSENSFVAHDFLQPQLVSDAAVFLIRNILHNWNNTACADILRHLRNAATENTRLVIGDFVLSLACSDETSNLEGTSSALQDISLTGFSVPPKPLLQNLGKANSVGYSIDLIVRLFASIAYPFSADDFAPRIVQMQAVLNAQERTLKEHVDLCASVGWKVTSVVMSKESQFSYLTAEPTTIPPYKG